MRQQRELFGHVLCSATGRSAGMLGGGEAGGNLDQLLNNATAKTAVAGIPANRVQWMMSGG